MEKENISFLDVELAESLDEFMITENLKNQTHSLDQNYFQKFLTSI